MKKSYIFLAVVVLVFFVTPSTQAQERKRLAILPFSGGEAQDGETISVLLSNQRALREVFTVQPRNSAIDRIMGEQQYQRQSGLINSDAISEIGKLNTADLVVSGHITRLRNTNLVLISIIDVTEIQQIAGVYQTYRSIEEIRGLLPGLSERLVEMSRKDYKNLPGLAVPSFSVPPGVNATDAMVLAQILATEIVHLGVYAVFPRNNSVDDVIREHQFQRSGQTSNALNVGTTRRIDYILSSSVMSLGRTNLFTSQILSIERGDVIDGTDRQYRDIADGLSKNLMREIAVALSGGRTSTASTSPPAPVATQKPARAERPPREPRAPREPREPKEPSVVDPEEDKAARLNTVGASLGTTFIAPVLIGTIHGSFSPFRHTLIKIGFDIGFLHGETITDENYSLDGYYSLYPFLHLGGFVPFSDRDGWYIGAGVGYMIAKYTFSDGVVDVGIFALDLTTGVNLFRWLDISYTLRTNFTGASNKLSVGYTYRF